MELLSNGSLQVKKQELLHISDFNIPIKQSINFECIIVFMFSALVRTTARSPQNRKPLVSTTSQRFGWQIWYFRKWKCSADPNNVVQCKNKTSEKVKVFLTIFLQIPNGVNGIEDRMAVIWERGVHSGMMSPGENGKKTLKKEKSRKISKKTF